ncbi:MAG TPA: hypothetical protein VM242_14720 [Acidimicrobiales bacterium]|jgi:peroxiredoxin|nr:hypothetical protein [Acidimicrobiales bacterium]
MAFRRHVRSGRSVAGPVDVGDRAPEIDLPDSVGDRWRLSDHRGAAVVLLFHRHLA